MNDLERSYTSTGDKLLRHPAAIADLRVGRSHPIVLHIMPTEQCNLKCGFCSVAHRGEAGKWYPDLAMSQIMDVVDSLLWFGLKAVIVSGGGEPLLYREINELLVWLSLRGLEIGLITNGTKLARLTYGNRRRLAWVRVSANTYDYVVDIDIPDMPGVVLGFSYVVNSETTAQSIDKVHNAVTRHKKVKYVRMLPDCNLPTDQLEHAHAELAELCAELGPPFFHQYKTHRCPAACYLGWVHPVLYTDGYIYPCDSLVLNCPPDDRRFHADYALCRWSEASKFYAGPIQGSLINTSKCLHCVFARQNDLLASIIAGMPLPEIPADMEHVNFI